MAPSSTSTAATGSSIERHYVDSEAYFEVASSIIIAGDEGIAGLSEPFLSEPIDFDSELAQRARTHEPLEPVSGDLTNSAFGI